MGIKALETQFVKLRKMLVMLRMWVELARWISKPAPSHWQTIKKLQFQEARMSEFGPESQGPRRSHVNTPLHALILDQDASNTVPRKLIKTIKV